MTKEVMGATYYIQVCPTCGRRLEVKIEYIGLEVSCYHCRARFMAENSPAQQASDTAVSMSVLSGIYVPESPCEKAISNYI